MFDNELEEELIQGWIEICYRDCTDHVILRTEIGELNIKRSGQIEINGIVYRLEKGLE